MSQAVTVTTAYLEEWKYGIHLMPLGQQRVGLGIGLTGVVF